MSDRRRFIKQATLGATALSVASTSAFYEMSKTSLSLPSHLKISLAQWSFHRALEKGEMNASDFAHIAKQNFGVHAVEYVNQFYTEKANNEKYWAEMKKRADDEEVTSLLIMVDEEGDLGSPDPLERIKSVENHYKWIHAAKILGCHSIRVNAFGEGDRASLKTSLIDGLGRLASYGAKENINILIENHGLHTSDAKFVVSIIEQVGNPYLGTLPDFGNWCLATKWGSTQNNTCSQVYDRYQGVSEFLPFAKGVSAKSYDFDLNGNETIINYHKMLKIVKDSGFNGYIGIEYEGEAISEPEGIWATKKLIEKVWNEIG
ncbi:sugar phosphate isomerase/epimerase family protein [Pareuzebyella sediminis]|uniref:sugar phosphate isomerase/epimerase family protein n=1 Tax=Pareuzebyella sediminis TaxID=2607998 RepID=UPI0011ED7376|nr:TIM barrel protein [Pareuzebyella sediminis]